MIQHLIQLSILKSDQYESSSLGYLCEKAKWNSNEF